MGAIFTTMVVMLISAWLASAMRSAMPGWT